MKTAISSKTLSNNFTSSSENCKSMVSTEKGVLETTRVSSLEWESAAFKKAPLTRTVLVKNDLKLFNHTLMEPKLFALRTFCLQWKRFPTFNRSKNHHLIVRKLVRKVAKKVKVLLTMKTLLQMRRLRMRHRNQCINQHKTTSFQIANKLSQNKNRMESEPSASRSKSTSSRLLIQNCLWKQRLVRLKTTSQCKATFQPQTQRTQRTWNLELQASMTALRRKSPRPQAQWTYETKDRDKARDRIEGPSHDN